MKEFILKEQYIYIFKEDDLDILGISYAKELFIKGDFLNYKNIMLAKNENGDFLMTPLSQLKSKYIKKINYSDFLTLYKESIEIVEQFNIKKKLNLSLLKKLQIAFLMDVNKKENIESIFLNSLEKINNYYKKTKLEENIF